MANHLIYTRELADEVCERLANGESTRAIAKSIGISYEGIRAWARRDYDGFRQRFDDAREAGAKYWIEEILATADDIPDDGDSMVAIRRAELQCRNRQWFLERLMPDKFGNRLDVKNTIGVTDPLAELLGSIAKSGVKVFGDRSE